MIGNNLTFILCLLLGKVIGLTSCFRFIMYSIFIFLSLNVINKPVLFIVYFYCLLRVEHYSGAPRTKRASGAPWVNKSTHPRKFGYHVTERPSDQLSVCTKGIPMFTLTLTSYFGSPGESWLHINVVINWQLSKQSIRWPVIPNGFFF